ncbi:MAG: FtsX-like permease family protein [Pseudomonadota bacterium]
MIRFLRSDEGPPIVPTRGWSAWITIMTAVAMGFLAIICLAAGIAAGRLAATWEADFEGLATVSVQAEAEVIETRVARAVETLETTPGIGKVRVLSETELAELMAPWLGDNLPTDLLPMPRLIEVERRDPGPDVTRLQARLEQTALGARYDDHQVWRGPLIDAASALSLLAWAATSLVVLTAAGMLALAAQASLAGNRDIVRVVRLIGASDGFIAQAFIARIALRGLAGGMAGAALGVLALTALPDLSSAGGVGLTLAPGPITSLLLLVLVPVATTAIALAAAWFAVRTALNRMI